MKLFALSLIIAASSAAVEKVNINMADATALDKIYDVGSVTAQRIINHRNNIAPFASVDELKLITGIGEATLNTIMQKGNAGTYALPDVGVACPMTCEVKNVSYHKHLAMNHTTILKISHVSNLASGAHGPATKHPLCGGSKAKFCAPRQRLLHKCYKIGDGSTCACVCDVCTDANNKAPCHSSKICGDDVAGDPLVYDSATDKCVKCGRWNNDRACANNMCLPTDINHAHKQLVYDTVAKKCARCGHGHDRIACDNDVCEATDESTGKKIHFAGSGKCGHCGERDGAPACGGTTCSVTDSLTGRKLALDTDGLTCVRCGHQNGAIPCPLNGNPTCETEDVNDATKKLVYDPATGLCKRCGHGHNMHACVDHNNVCEATDITTGHEIAFNPDNGKCWNCGAKHNQPACNHPSHATQCTTLDSVTGFELAFDAATGKCVRCGYRDNTVPCNDDNGEQKECALTDADDASKKLVYKASTGKCVRCGHGHDLLPCDRTNAKCHNKDDLTWKSLKFDEASGKCVCKHGDQHNKLPCDRNAPYVCQSQASGERMTYCTNSDTNHTGCNYAGANHPDDGGWHGKCMKCGAKHNQPVCTSGALCDASSSDPNKPGQRLVALRRQPTESQPNPIQKCFDCGQTTGQDA
eukprot:g5864.t1